MINKYNTLSLRWGVPGLVLAHAGYLVFWVAARSPTAESHPILVLPSLALIGVGNLLLLVGLAFYAVAKGHHPAWCLVGVLSCLGILVLALLPDRGDPTALDDLDDLPEPSLEPDAKSAPWKEP